MTFEIHPVTELPVEAAFADYLVPLSGMRDAFHAMMRPRELDRAASRVERAKARRSASGSRGCAARPPS
jgi:hypothetical protein